MINCFRLLFRVGSFHACRVRAVLFCWPSSGVVSSLAKRNSFSLSGAQVSQIKSAPGIGWEARCSVSYADLTENLPSEAYHQTSWSGASFNLNILHRIPNCNVLSDCRLSDKSRFGRATPVRQSASFEDIHKS
jgi:hypothetical protein